jgi:PilZ domain
MSTIPGKPSSPGGDDQINRRQHFRVKMIQPVEVVINVVGAKLPVLLVDMSAGGMRFISDVKFPVTPLYVYEVEMKLLNNHVKISGHVLRISRLAEGIYDYGFIFESDDKEQFSAVYQLVNELSIFLRRNPTYTFFQFPIVPQLWKGLQMIMASRSGQPPNPPNPMNPPKGPK